MELENQVVSLDLAKRLKELKVKQESLFYWSTRTFEPGLTGPNPITALILGTEINQSQYHKVTDEIIASAFTVAELGEILPVANSC